jgi:hypothetical protein
MRRDWTGALKTGILAALVAVSDKELCAAVAQLDRVLASEARGRGFESRRSRHRITLNRALQSRPQAIFAVLCIKF